MPKKERIHSLDYLRGIMAVSIMLYHYLTWSDLSYGRFLNVLSVYGVSIFYILSGLSLALAYEGRLTSARDAIGYFIKRIFRILPLFGLAVTGTLILKYAQYIILQEEFNTNFYEVILNYSLLFGFIDTSLYLPIGGWSIGNEMVFYAFFPVIIFFVSKNMNITLYVTYFVSFLIYIYFAFYLLSNVSDSLDKWYLYINPFNQFFLFYSGVMISFILPMFNLKKRSGYILMAAIFFLFIFYHGDAERIDLTEGIIRILFSFLSIGLVFIIYKTKVTAPRILDKSLIFLGETSYSIYLLHPIIGLPVIFVFNYFGLEIVMGCVLSIMITLYVSHLSYKHIEKPMMKKGSLLGAKFRVVQLS